MEGKHRIEILVAVITAVGIICAAVIYNFDKLFSSGKAESSVGLTSYIPTNDIETELRHYAEITGVRNGIQAVKARLESKYREQYKLTNDELACIIDTSFFANDYIDIFIEAHKKYMTLQEVQELNRFYSSKVMTNFQKKQTVIIQEFLEDLDRLAERKYKTFKKLTTSSKTGDGAHLQTCPTK